MTIDHRTEAAKYYDLQKVPFEDIPFYKERIPSPDADVLELGCGTGRVTVPLAGHCRYIHGLDISEAMLNICREKLQKGNVPKNKARVTVADITNFDLGCKFDFVIAPYRVFQNLEADDQIKGFFKCIRKHLAANGSCILNVFKPLRSREALIKEWTDCVGENLCSDITVEGKRVTAHERRLGIDKKKCVIYPALVYRVYDGDVLEDQQVLEIAMRCYWPDEFEKLITDHGFEVVSKWGGYDNEVYGQGNELVVEFKDGILQKNDLQSLKW